MNAWNDYVPTKMKLLQWKTQEESEILAAISRLSAQRALHRTSANLEDAPQLI